MTLESERRWLNVADERELAKSMAIATIFDGTSVSKYAPWPWKVTFKIDESIY
jgi:hypothetical protein